MYLGRGLYSFESPLGVIFHWGGRRPEAKSKKKQPLAATCSHSISLGNLPTRESPAPNPTISYNIHQYPIRVPRNRLPPKTQAQSDLGVLGSSHHFPARPRANSVFQIMAPSQLKPRLLPPQLLAVRQTDVPWPSHGFNGLGRWWKRMRRNADASELWEVPLRCLGFAWFEIKSTAWSTEV